MGTKWHTQILHHPVQGTVLYDNDTTQLVGVATPFAWVYAPVAGLDPGQAPAIDLFLMVAPLWVVK